MVALGIDIGGSGIKGALVDVEAGILTTDRFRIPTPQPSLPPAVAEVVGEIARRFDWEGAIGCTFPAVVHHGVVHTAANVDDAWIGTDAQALFQEATGCPVTVVNDADAAGLAEISFGAGRGQKGVVLIVTLGTGIGTSLFVDGHLLPNTELGHIEIDGTDAEVWAAESARKRKDLSWKAWAKHVEKYLGRMEFLFSPDLIIVGGGVSKKHEKYFPHIELKTPMVPAQMLNNAGIVGAAMATVQPHGQ